MKEDKWNSVGSKEVTIFYRVDFNKVTFEQRLQVEKQAMWLFEGKTFFVPQGTKALSCQSLVSF